jgi:hypothetical protein
MRKSVFALLALLLALTSQALAGTLVAPLDEMVASGDPTQKIGVIVAMADMVDNESLNMSLKSRQATLAERHYEVVTTLQAKATSTQAPVLAILNDLESQGKVESIRNFWISNMIAFKGTPDAIREVVNRTEINKIYFDFPVESIQPIIGDDAPPMTTSHTNGADVINAPQVWAMGYTGAGRIVSNIDTGVDGTHPALSARWRGNNGHPAIECWKDPIQNTPTPSDNGQHGTHTMGTICGRSTTGAYDTIGVAINAQWIAAGAIDDGSSTAQIIECFQWIADPDGNPGTTSDVPDAVGNSWGWSPIFHGVPPCDQTFWSAIDGCENAGVVVVFSAGNEGSYGPNSLRTPADRATTYTNAFSVGAVDGHTAGYPIASFSSLGPCQCATGDMNIKPECVAPGVNVYSSIPGGGYAGDWSGTSMASPHITGSVAVLRQVNPNLDSDAIKNIILQASDDLGPVGEDNTYGHGVLDLYQAVQIAMTGYGFADGFVRDAGTSAPLQATVSVVGAANQVTANGSGYYIMGLSADTSYTLRATYFGYTPINHTVAIIANDTTSQNFLLSPAPSAVLQGTVTSSQGGPIVGASVTVLNTPLAPTTTNGSGFYQFPSIPVGHSADVRVQMVGYSQGSGNIVIQNGTNVLDFLLQPSESFELNNGGYSGTGVWEWGVPTSGPNAAHSGTKLWATILGGDYPDLTDDSLLSREYAITGANARLEFYHWYNFETSWDGGNVSISTNGGVTWTLLTPDGGYPDADISALGEPGYTSTSDWTLASFDISSYLGQSVRFMWRFGSDGSIVRPGWYVDDVSVPGSSAPLPPNITFDPSTFNVLAAPGQIETRPLNIGNTGAGNLSFSLSPETYNLILESGLKMPVEITAAEPAPIGFASEETKGGIVQRPSYPPVIAGQGGPDAFGHKWIDSDEPGGPPVIYVDISAVGTPITLADDNYLGPFAIGFSFPYFGNSYTQLYVGSNGYVSFGAGSNSNVFVGIPSSGTPNNFIAAMWEDVNPAAGGSVRYYYDSANQRFIVSYDDVLYWTPSGNTGSLDFQILLYASGKIEMNYGTLNPGTHNLSTNTVGIENAGGTDGLQIAYNAAYLHSNLSISITTGWLFATPTSGNIIPGGNTSATITFDASALNVGVYSGNIGLNSNDPETPAIDIPVTFNVGSGGTPNIIVTPTTLRDTLNVNESAGQNLKIRNTGDGTLAMTFSDSANWISVATGPRYVAPGDSIFEAITLNGAGLAPGTYTSRVVVTSNDPDTPNSLVTVILFVPTPNIVQNPTSINDTLITDQTAVHNLRVRNTGPGTLAVTFSDSAAWISVPTDPYFIAAGDSLIQQVTLDAAGLMPGTYISRVVTSSNDPDTPNILTSVTLFVPTPNIVVNPTSINDTLAQGGTTTHYVTVSNSGQGLLNFSATAQSNLILALDSGRILPVKISPISERPLTRFDRPSDEIKVQSDGPTNPPQILNQGGPDTFGNRWIDSDEPGGPTYNWVDIAAFGVPITGLGDDTNVGPYPIGFSFPFFGTSFTDFRFCTNGFVSFSSAMNSYDNLTIPSASAPLDLLAAMWDDMDFLTSGNAYYYANNADSLVISWVDVPHFTSGGPYTFQIILLINGSITYQYQTINIPDNSATIGIQNSTGSDGLQVVFNAAYLHNNLAVKFTSSWLGVSPTSGSINPGGQAQLAVTLDATSLADGVHTGTIVIGSNDPDTPIFNVPVSLLVGGTGSPEISLSETSFDDTVFVGNSIVRPLYIANAGTASLFYGVHDNRAWITVAPDTGNVPGSLTDTVTVTFSAVALTPGTYAGQINVNSNDADEGLTTLPVNLVVRDTGGNDCVYFPGDINGNGSANGIDVTYGVAFFKGGAVPPIDCNPPCVAVPEPFYASGDVNGNCAFNGIDITFYVAYLKGMQPALQYCPSCPPATLSAPALVRPASRSNTIVE